MNQSNRHAYLIMAHNEPEIFHILINLLDDERNDIFVHVDKKSDISLFLCKTHRSRIFFLENRIKVYWGDISQIKTELSLFEFALKYSIQNNGGGYKYYHLLSGIDLPLKSQNYIHDFFSRTVCGKNVMNFVSDDYNKNDLLYKTGYYWLFTKFSKCNDPIKKMLVFAQKAIVHLQRIIRFRRKYECFLKKGSNWCSITSDFCKYLVENKDKILQMFKYTSCTDEVYKQTALWNSEFRNTVYDFDYTKKTSPSLRLIDWTRGKPYIWNVSDYDMLKQTDCLFARKFSSANMEIVHLINDFIKNS